MVDPEAKINQGEPLFKDIDNPGNWSSYSFTPKFGKDKQYQGHFLPTGCVPVPEKRNKYGRKERKEGGWSFYYDGWVKVERLPKH